jgi:putative oxidoreductase
MADDSTLPKLIPVLAWYRPFEAMGYAFIRFCTGALIVPHGVSRLFYNGSHAELGGFLANIPVTAIGAFELVGGACLALGLLTRPVALLFVIEWAGIAFAVPTPSNASWIMMGESLHYPTFVAALCVAFVFRGGGHYSLDRLIGKEF